MGRRSSPSPTMARPAMSCGANAVVRVLCALAILALASLASTLLITDARAQTLSEKLASRAKTGDSRTPDRVLVQADEMTYNKDQNTVAARGNVQVYYQGRVLQADRVTYDRKASRVYAEGRAKLTERDGSVAYADRFELTDDFKNGFIDSLRADTAEKTHITAARAERSDGETTILERGTYTACETCKDDPSRPPLWQVRAKRVIHKNSEQMVYYEDADIEILGTPVAWIPYFSVPDPSVRRKSGFLSPQAVLKSNIGAGVSIPYLWVIAPNMDLTLTPTVYSRQGFLAEAEFRHRIENGVYSIRLAGIYQADPGAFSAPPWGAGNKQFRGSVDSRGQFFINDKWKFGWDVTLFSDRWFQTDYRLPGESLSSNYFKETSSTIYLNGQGERSFFDLRGYYFQALSRYDLQQQQPVVGPVLDYNKTFDLQPKDTGGIGGQVEITANLTHITRDLAAFQSIGARSLDKAYGLYDVCETAGVPTYNRSACLLRGIAGDYARATLDVSWKRKFIDPIGEVWTPFAFAHVNGSVLDLNTTNSATFTGTSGTSVIANGNQPTFVGTGQGTVRGDVVPGIGLEWRYPFMAQSIAGTHVFEPIAQIVVRPNETVNRALVNEDAQSLVFDDTNLFDWSRFSGNDRFEGGTRANYGAQYTMTFEKGGYLNAMIGQSFQIAGRNSYASPDAANIGISSGLDTRKSDYVSRFAIAPNSAFGFIAKSRFDQGNMSLRRLDLMTYANFGPLEASIQYARYAAQPQIGYSQRREGLAANAKLKLNENYFVTGNVIFDMSRHLYNTQFGGHAPLFSIAGLGIGGGYTDDCTTLAVSYTSVYQDTGAGTPTRNQTVLVQLQLRTLGDTKFKSGLSDIKIEDGLGAAR